MKIVEFFRRLFTDENGTETNQIIITTHSPFIIHNEHRKNDKVIIINNHIDRGQRKERQEQNNMSGCLLVLKK